MLDIKIRVVTYVFEQPGTYTSLKYCLEAWRINAGSYYEKTSFTVLLPEQINAECLHACKQLALSYPIEIKRVSETIISQYQSHWQMSFLDEHFDADVIIFCPPYTLVSNDLSRIIEKSHLEGVVLAPGYFDLPFPNGDVSGTSNPVEHESGAAGNLLISPLRFACVPEIALQRFKDAIPSALNKYGTPVGRPLEFREYLKFMALAFASVLSEKHIKHAAIEPGVLCELSGRQLRSSRNAANYADALLFSITDAPENEHTWLGTFNNVQTIQKFLDNTALTGAWLYYQRNLHRVHASLYKSATVLRKRSLFKASGSPYYIYALDYIQQSAGIRALHYLCNALNESGREAYVNCNVTVPHLRTPLLSNRIIKQHQASGRTPIVVYPEIVSGNPLAGKVVVRWMLNQPGHLDGDKYFQNDDLIFAYDPHYLPAGMHGEILHIPTSDSTIFNNDNNPFDEKREFVCFYAHKYLLNGGKLTPHAKDAVSLCKDQNLTHSEIAGILRRSKLLYAYEPTALIAEALMCGCPVSVIQTDYWRENTANFSYTTDWGMVMDDSPESLALAKANVRNYRDFREDVVLKAAWEQIDRFVELTQNAAGARAELMTAGPSDAEELNSPEYEAEGTYGLWRNAQSRDAHVVRSDESGGGLRQGMSFHLIVLVAEDKADILSGTRLAVSKQSHACARLTYVAQTPIPEVFDLSGKDAWLNIPAANYAGEVNRLVTEDVDSDFLVFLNAGDVVEPHALNALAEAFGKHPAWQMAFADQDILLSDGKLARPFFKPDFEPDRVRAAPFVADGMLAIRRSAFLELGGLKSASFGAERFELMLRCHETSGESGIGHVSDVLCHCEADAGSGGALQGEIVAARRRVLQEHLARIGADTDVKDGVFPGTFHIRYHHGDAAAVSIIIPTLNGGAVLQDSVNGIVANTEYKNWELIVVDMQSDDADTLAFLDYLRAFNNDAIRVISQPRSASLPALLNAGARIARQDYLLFLSDSAKPVQGDWLDEMLGYAVQPGVGAVGGKGIGQGNTISNAAYILGLDGRPAVSPELHAPLDASGYFGRLQVPGNPSAVAFTCMLTEKKLFDELGGFDEQALAGGYSDVDYCLKVGKAGRRVVWTPFALMLQRHMTEPPKELDVDDEEDEVEEKRLWIFPGPAAQTMFDRWLDRIAFDPAYNRNLSLNMYSSKFAAKAFKIETLPALTRAPDNRPAPCILGLNGDNTGCGEYRIIAPLRALVNAAKVCGLNDSTYLSVPELARMSPDVLVFQRPILEQHIKLVELYARYSGAFRVYELDDLITNIQYSNQARHIIQGKDLIPRFRHVVELCDRFVVSTEYLAQEYRKLKTDIRVVPNYIERAKWEGLATRRRQGRKPRVGWAGSNSHAGDLAIIADVVKALSDEVEWVFLGLCPEGVRNLVEYHSSVPIKDYPAKLASLNLDLAIAPLEEVPFNHAKSYLKLLEYGMLGYPVVCTDMTPYRGAYPVTRVKNRLKHWVDAIREHVSDMDELAKRGDALRDYTRANWMLEDNLDTWLKAWLPQ